MTGELGLTPAEHHKFKAIEQLGSNSMGTACSEVGGSISPHEGTWGCLASVGWAWRVPAPRSPTHPCRGRTRVLAPQAHGLRAVRQRGAAGSRPTGDHVPTPRHGGRQGAGPARCRPGEVRAPVRRPNRPTASQEQP